MENERRAFPRVIGMPRRYNAPSDLAWNISRCNYAVKQIESSSGCSRRRPLYESMIDGAEPDSTVGRFSAIRSHRFPSLRAATDVIGFIIGNIRMFRANSFLNENVEGQIVFGMYAIEYRRSLGI